MTDLTPSLIVHPGELAQHPLNSNTHSAAHIQELAESRRALGQYRNIVVWVCPETVEVENARGEPVTLKKGITYVLAGNGFHQAALLRGDSEIEVKDRSDLSLDEALLLMETDNASPLGSQPDPAQLRANLERARGLTVDRPALAEMLERARVNGVEREPPQEPPEVTQTEAEKYQEQWQVKLGDVWQLGKHKIACVDSTDEEAVKGLFNGRQADLWITDPPYGVGYADKNKYLNAISRGNRIQTPIRNDHLSIEDVAEQVWRPAFKVAYLVASDKASYYTFMPQGGDQMMMMMMMNEHWIPRHELIWLKNNHVLGRADYNYKHEPILYGWKRDGTHQFYGGFQTSVIECDKPLKSEFHPTTKPLELICKLINNSSRVGDLVYDGFLGSGTTLLACDGLGRDCIGADIAPECIATVLHRFQQLTNLTPHRLTDG